MDQEDQGDHNPDNQAAKQPSNSNENDDDRIVPLTRSDFALSTIESESESESESSGDENYTYDHEDYEFFDSDLGFLEEQYSGDEEMDDDDDDDDGIDVDELTYEELIALGEFIGVEERGLSYREISTCLRPMVWKTTRSKSVVVVDRCVICQVEYEESEDLVALHCEHAYHSECITKWLHIKKCCPICSSEVSSSSSSSSSNNQTNTNIIDCNNNNNKDL